MLKKCPIGAAVSDETVMEEINASGTHKMRDVDQLTELGNVPEIRRSRMLEQSENNCRVARDR